MGAGVVQLLCAVVAGVCVVHGNTNLRWFTFWDYVPQDFAGWTNFAFTDSFQDINTGTTLGIKHLFSLQSSFITTNANNSYILRPDYQQKWKDLVPVMQSLFANHSIFGFFMGDEVLIRPNWSHLSEQLIWNGLDPKDLDAAVMLVIVHGNCN